MSDPRRWRDDASLPEDTRALLRGARRSRPMTAAERLRTAERVAPLVAIPMAAGTLLWVKGLALAFGVVVAATVVLRTMPDRSDAAASPTQTAEKAAPAGARSESTASAAKSADEPVAEPPSPDAQSRPVEEKAAPRAPAPAPAPSPAPPPEPVGSGDTLAEEARMLEEARALVGASPGQALARLDQHAAKYPRGQLGAERELLAVDALRRAGRTAEARARGEALLARSKGGLYEERVRRMLSTLP
jgi:hypothetical protein